MMKKAAYCLILVLIAANLSAAGFGRDTATAYCGIKVVSYKFVGNAGTEITYGNNSFTIPQSGAIELVAVNSANSYQLSGKSFAIPQNVTVDEFGAATVEIPSPRSPLPAGERGAGVRG